MYIPYSRTGYVSNGMNETFQIYCRPTVVFRCAVEAYSAVSTRWSALSAVHLLSKDTSGKAVSKTLRFRQHSEFTGES